MVENHPADSRVRITDDGKSQTLDARMGMGGGNTPLVLEHDETPKTLKIRSGKDGGGKGALVQENQSATLGCNNDQTLFVPFVKTARARTPEEISTFEQKEVANTLNTFDIGETRCNEMVVALEGNGARPSHKGNGYSEDDKSLTLNTIEQHAVAYDSEKVKTLSNVHSALCAADGEKGIHSQMMTSPEENFVLEESVINDKKPIGFYPQMKAESVTPLEDKQPCLVNGTNPGFQNGVMQPTFGIGRDAFNMGANSKFGMSIDEEKQPTMVAKGPGAVSCIGVDGYNQCSTGDKAKSLRTSQNVDAVPCVMNTNYIVRRLTPTECARLQGFPDWWAHDLGTKHATQEEVAFWQEVWNTWNAINGAPQKKESAVKAWLRDPYSDAAEYKMWGNGVALPCVTFVLAGIEWADRTNQEGKAPVYDRQLSIFDF